LESAHRARGSGAQAFVGRIKRVFQRPPLLLKLQVLLFTRELRACLPLKCAARTSQLGYRRA
jgi:hypothetical protein